jgi:hypothetical protein
VSVRANSVRLVRTTECYRIRTTSTRYLLMKSANLGNLLGGQLSVFLCFREKNVRGPNLVIDEPSGQNVLTITITQSYGKIFEHRSLIKCESNFANFIR